MDKNAVGKIGEDIAAEHLSKNGYKIIARNYRQIFGELDIIAKYVDSTLVFFEIKTMTQSRGVDAIIPEDQMTPAKTAKLKKIAQFYALKNPSLVDSKHGWRIDVLAIEIPNFSPGATYHDFYSMATVRHYENI